MKYGILNKETKKFFAGFKNNQAQWTSLESKAWTNTNLIAKGQASLFISLGIKVQRKTVLV